jgi:hypothetical protein
MYGPDMSPRRPGQKPESKRGPGQSTNHYLRSLLRTPSVFFRTTLVLPIQPWLEMPCLEAGHDVLQAAGCAAGALGHLLNKRVPIRLERLRGKGSSGSLRRSDLAFGRALGDCFQLLPLQSGALCLQKGLGRLEKGLTVGPTARPTTAAAARPDPRWGPA